MVLTAVTQGREGFAGGEDQGGGVVRSLAAKAFRWRFGEVGARTGFARRRRCQWWRRRGRGVVDGGVGGDGRCGGCRWKNAKSDELEGGGKKWVVVPVLV